jgi:hypothetical protein
MTNKTIGRPIEMTADIAMQIIENTETCISQPPSYFALLHFFMSMV